MSRVLVTGATGYLGKRLVPLLLAGGHEVRALVRDPSTAAQPAGVEVVQGDLTDAPSLERAAAGEDVVVNLASITADRKPPKGGYEVVNADGVGLAGARGRRRRTRPRSSTSAASTRGAATRGRTWPAAARATRPCAPRRAVGDPAAVDHVRRRPTPRSSRRWPGCSSSRR